MKNIILQILIILLIVSCKENPNYNPFDNQYDVSVQQLINDNCDTIPAGCGYFNLVTREGKLKPYYQIHMEDFNQVVGKGFIYEIDTFRVNRFNDRYSDKDKIDSIINLPIDKLELNEEFGKFGYHITSISKDSVQIVNKEKLDTIELELETYPTYGNQYLVRGIGYFMSKKDDTD